MKHPQPNGEPAPHRIATLQPGVRFSGRTEVRVHDAPPVACAAAGFASKPGEPRRQPA